MLVGGKQQLEKMTRTMEWGESITDRTPEYEYLRDQAIDDLYYVVASAYDYPALTKNERRLIWRTTMTVSARGVSMEETLVPLVNTAAPYFGHEMEDPNRPERQCDRGRAEGDRGWRPATEATKEVALAGLDALEDRWRSSPMSHRASL